MKMISRRSFLNAALATSVTALAATALTACGASSSTAAAGSTANSTANTSKGDGKGTIGILMPSLNAEFFVNTANSLAATVEAQGYKSNIQSFNMDASQAVTVIENFITDGVVGIAYMTVDTAGDDALKEAMDAGIKVLTCGVETENYDVCQIVDNYTTGHQIGEMAAEYIKEHFDGKAQIGTVETIASQNMIDRCNGFKDALAELVPESEIVYTANVSSDTGEGTTFAENLNTLYPDCKVMVGYSDTHAKEVAEVWTALGYPSDAATFSHDGEAPVLASIAEGGYCKGTICLGDAGISMGEGIMDCIDGKYDPHTLVVMGGYKVTAANIAEYYQG